MNRVVREWVRKAEADYRVALRESRVKRDPSHEAVCFHAQQCAEKYIKAVLLRHCAPVPHIHDLVVLRRLAIPVSACLRRRIAGLARLSAGAVRYRYPGRRATMAGARQAVACMSLVRERARRELGLD